MPPKNKDKHKEKKKEENKPTKSQYLAKIAEQNAILAKTKTETRIIEDIYYDTEKKYEQLQEDMADIIKYLQHEIEENEEETATYNEKITEFHSEIHKNNKYYESIFSKMDDDYEAKHMELNHQLQLLNAKLIASEDIRQEREEYLKKKEELLKNRLEMEARHQEEIYVAEKLAIIEQDKTQTDMEINLTKLATEFRQASDIAIGETTNNLIRDNINLGNTLTCMQEIVEKERIAFQKAQAVEKNYKYSAELLEDEQNLIWDKHVMQVQAIEAILKSQEELKERIGSVQNLIKENRRLQRENTKEDFKLKAKVAELNELLKVQEEHEETANAVKVNFNAIRSNVIKLELCLFETAKKVKEGVEIENLTRLEEKDDEIPVELDKDEQEENLKEFKYKARESAIEVAVDKLCIGLLSDTEMQLAAPSSESYLTSFSLTSDIGRIRSYDTPN